MSKALHGSPDHDWKKARDAKRVLKRRWLAGVRVFGALLTALSVFTSLRWSETDPVWASVELQFGSAVLIFAVLFVIERKFIRRQVQESTQQLIESFTEDSFAEFARSVPEDARRMAEPGGPVEVAGAWRGHVLSGEYEQAWSLGEANWRLCRLQAWIYNNQGRVELSGRTETERFLEEMVSDAEHPEWNHFFHTERNQFLEAWPLSQEQWGTSSKRRCIGPGYDLIITTPLGARTSGYVPHGPAQLPSSMQLLMHRTDEGWLLAAYGGPAPPQQGWPPAWWMPGDPAGENV